MAGEKEIVVAIEFGSSKIRGVAGYKNMEGGVQVLAIEQVDARNCIRRGVVYNIDKTVLCLKGIIEKMEAALDMRIRRAFVGIGGQSVRTRKNVISRQFATKTVISQELVDSLLKNNRNTAYAGCEILEVVPQEYRVGLDTTTDPVGVLSSQIEGTYQNVVARVELKEYVLKCVENCGLEVAGLFVTPLVLADCVLTDTEKRSGCALVDFGFGTTTVAIYKNNLLRHLAVIPLGGNNITQDISTQQIEEDEAEELKLKYGSAFAERGSDDLGKNLLVNNGRTIEERLLVDIVEAREEEILSNVWAQIRQSGYRNDLMAGVVVTGGASNVQNLDKALSESVRLEKMRFVRTVPFAVQAVHADRLAKDGSQNALLALLYAGGQNCAEPREKPVPQPEPGEIDGGETTVSTDAPEDGNGTGGTSVDRKPSDHPEEKKPSAGLGKRLKNWLGKLTTAITED